MNIDFIKKNENLPAQYININNDMDKIALATFADFLINIAAGWFGAGHAALFIAGSDLMQKIGLLTVNIVFGILFLHTTT